MTISRRSVLLGALSATLVAACDPARRGRAGAPSTAAPSLPPAPSTTQPTTTAVTAAPAGPARFIKSGPDRNQIALTFHGSGDPTLAARLLDEARRSGAPITVFAVGQWLVENPTMAQTLETAGHELANHTYTHPALRSVSRSTLVSEITRCRDVLQQETGSTGRWFRPSGTDEPTQAMLEEAGAAGYSVVVGYDVDPLDYQDPGAAAIVERVGAGLHPGAVVSLHTGHAGTVTAFGPIVADIRRAGFQPVLLRDLLA
ncbi:MAG TPA: polysaccharide deacetylase family protein [Acidimicrobiales bacterium]|nr:polysaccharide deacetylase family protein [Acidimicrobiales bacterium]